MNSKFIDHARLMPSADVIAVIAIVSAYSRVASAQDAFAAGAQNWGTNSIVVVITAIVVCICVLLHYEVLNFLSGWLFHLEGRRRHRVLFVIFGMLSVHVAEIWIFGIAYTVLLLWPAFGTVSGIAGGVLDHVYLSAVTFTTVGAADVHLGGPIRFIAGTEALTGLILITWSASFTFLEMGRFWRER